MLLTYLCDTCDKMKVSFYIMREFQAPLVVEPAWPRRHIFISRTVITPWGNNRYYVTGGCFVTRLSYIVFDTLLRYFCVSVLVIVKCMSVCVLSYVVFVFGYQCFCVVLCWLCIMLRWLCVVVVYCIKPFIFVSFL